MRVEATWEVTAPWSSTQKQHTSTDYTISLKICSDPADLKRKLKLTREVVPPKPTSSQPPVPIDTPIEVQFIGSLYFQVLTEMGKFN